jgi:hypothetical protein
LRAPSKGERHETTSSASRRRRAFHSTPAGAAGPGGGSASVHAAGARGGRRVPPSEVAGSRAHGRCSGHAARPPGLSGSTLRCLCATGKNSLAVPITDWKPCKLPSGKNWTIAKPTVWCREETPKAVKHPSFWLQLTCRARCAKLALLATK